jgi:hypothetical protein
LTGITTQAMLREADKRAAKNRLPQVCWNASWVGASKSDATATATAFMFQTPL